MAVDEKKTDLGGTCKGDVTNKSSGKGTERWTFPQNITVDDLYLYRKKRSNLSRNRDSLKIEEGSFKLLKTEYQRRFKNFYESFKPLDGYQPVAFFDLLTKPEPSLKLEGVHDFDTEYNESFNRHSLERLTKPVHRVIGFKKMDGEETTSHLENSAMRRGTAR